jgi:hypothetical protein
MPNTFKALATISVWTLWIAAWIIGLGTLVMGINRGTLFGSETPPVQVWIGFSVALSYLFLSVVAMKLRKMLE